VAPVHFAGLSARCWRACPASRHAVLSCERASKHASTAGWCRWTRRTIPFHYSPTLTTIILGQDRTLITTTLYSMPLLAMHFTPIR
jgi:hypothetical protein